MKRNFSLLLFVFFLVGMSSCSVEKRLYRPGWYVQRHHSAAMKSEREEPGAKTEEALVDTNRSCARAACVSGLKTRHHGTAVAELKIPQVDSIASSTDEAVKKAIAGTELVVTKEMPVPVLPGKAEKEHHPVLMLLTTLAAMLLLGVAAWLCLLGGGWIALAVLVIFGASLWVLVAMYQTYWKGAGNRVWEKIVQWICFVLLVIPFLVLLPFILIWIRLIWNDRASWPAVAARLIPGRGIMNENAATITRTKLLKADTIASCTGDAVKQAIAGTELPVAKKEMPVPALPKKKMRAARKEYDGGDAIRVFGMALAGMLLCVLAVWLFVLGGWWIALGVLVIIGASLVVLLAALQIRWEESEGWRKVLYGISFGLVVIPLFLLLPLILLWIRLFFGFME